MFSHCTSKGFMFSTVPSILLQKMKWAVDIAYMKENVWWGNVEVTGRLEDLDVDGGLIKI